MELNSMNGFAGMVQLPSANADGGSGGSGDGGNTNSGAGFGGNTSSNLASGTAASGGSSQLEVDEDTPIRVKGQDKPFSYKDVRGFQAQWTRAAQERARLERELQTERGRRESYERQQQQSQQRQQGQSQSDDIISQLEKLPYLDGKAAVQVVRGIGQQLQQRDMVLLAALNQMKQMKSTLDTLNGNHVNSAFEGKISRWLKEGNYPDEAADLAKEIYLAYEGDDLDQEFPRIFKNRWEQLNRLVNASRDAATRKAREAKMFVPGKGGNAGPHAPTQLKGNETPAELANKLWDQFGESDT
jgi:hypothetical protein